MIPDTLCSNGESPLIDHVIEEFLQAEAEGRAGDRQEWLNRFPSCAAALADFFDDREDVERLMMPVRLDRRLSPNCAEQTTSHAPQCVSSGFETIDIPLNPPQLPSTRYRPISFHARGGMGEIWLAKDERIGRHVAIKRLRAGHNLQESRFTVEAQITGQLEHPSVVPLHDFGVDEAGQPFYVMKFIHGRRLRDAITSFHRQKSLIDWPHNVDFRRLLENFITVCKAIAFAHDKGVVHRDIKPDNIMLGAYGEVLLIDWGLAKVVGEPDGERDTGVCLSSGGSTATRDGSIIGSPVYMSPEGAEGRPDAIDEASDVYLAGATLYEIICGRPPRQASSSWELIDLALHSRPTSPRKIDRRIPRPLEAICMKAMAFDKGDRYNSPLSLADDLERYLAGAATVAYHEPLWVKAARWIRQHRRGILQGVAAASLLFLAAFSVQKSHQARQLAERELARGAQGEFNRLADDAQFFAANTDAISERVPYYDPRHARDTGDAALAVLAPWGDRAERFPLAEDRAELLKSEYALLLQMAQLNLQGTPTTAELRQTLAILNHANRIELATRGYHHLRSQCLAYLGESASAQVENELATNPSMRSTPQDHFLAGEQLRLKDVGGSDAILDKDAFRAARQFRTEELSAAMDEYRQALTQDPRHFWAQFQLGRCLLALGRCPEAVEALSTCIAMRPNSPWAYSARGLANALCNRRDDAFRDLNESMRLDPEFQPARLNRGVVYWLNNSNKDALAEFDAIIATSAEKRLSEAVLYRGQVLLAEGRNREAIADFSALIAERPGFAPGHWFRAMAEFRLPDFDAGSADLKKCLVLEQDQTKSGDDSNQHLLFGKSLRNMAQQLDGRSRTRLLLTALDELQQAINGGSPTIDMWKQLGALRELLEHNADGIDAYSRGLALDVKDSSLLKMRGWAYANQHQYALAKRDFTDVVRNAPGDAEAHAGLGYVLGATGQSEAAHQEATSALLTGADNYLILHQVACIFARLSAAQPESKVEHENRALAALTRAISVSQQNPIDAGADERALMRKESAFPDSLKSRPEFQRLLAD